MTPNKACPVVFRDSSYSRILVFKHPLAGIQLVKGTIEPGEEPAQAALRELCEESGICRAKLERDLGIWDSGFENQVWSLHLCSPVDALPETWVHHTTDGGGFDLEFYWHPIEQAPDQDWHRLFRLALMEILERLRNSF
jgi:8-oxo-dGTP pyrophosphatase MutT (NUDIX family)